MSARQTSGADAPNDMNHLRRGTHYTATTAGGSATGEYLGMESVYGDRAILLRHPDGTASIDLRDVESILPLVA